MTENEFLLLDRIQKIQQIIYQYGENNFVISFSGGKDSTVLSELVDRAIPDNNIPRVYVNTGIELNAVYEFVKSKVERDNRFIIIQPKVNIVNMLNEVGYPYKSKQHSYILDLYQNNGKTNAVKNYLGESDKKWSRAKTCPKRLKYQFTDNFNLKVSDKCCIYLKEKPIQDWAKENNKQYHIVGIMRSEGGRRTNAQCLVYNGDKLVKFQPLAPMTKEWEDWFIETYSIDICYLYKPPYNFTRTGCKGCPFNIELQQELDILEKYFPTEKKQCELIWKPVYDEYRRTEFRLHDMFVVR